jgi:hypothetical protein
MPDSHESPYDITRLYNFVVHVSFAADVNYARNRLRSRLDPSTLSCHNVIQEQASRAGVFMSKKSTPGDGGHGKGSKGLPGGEAPRGITEFMRGIIRGLRLLRRG